MNEFNSGCEQMMPRTLIADQFGSSERKHRTKTFSAARDQMAGESRNKRDFALHPVENYRIHRIHTACRQREHRLKRWLFTGKRDDLCAHATPHGGHKPAWQGWI